MAYPSAHYLRESLRAGELPLWNPLSNCGAPFLAQWGTMCLYPGSLFFVALPMPLALGVFCLLHLWLGGLGARALAERWTGNRFAAAVAGTAFAINGASLACITWPNYCVALGWMPWIILLTEQAWREGGRKLVLAALAGTMQMLTGVPELVILTWGLLGVMLVAEWFQGLRFKVQSQSAHDCSKPPHPPTTSVPLAPTGGEGRGEGASHPQPIAYKSPNPSQLITNHFSLLTRFLFVILLITALSAAQLLPFFDLLAHSQRDAAYRDARWPMPPWGWANLLVPLFRYFQTPQGFWVQQDQQFLSSYYLGLGVLALALVAVWKSRERRVWLLAGATLFALIMALGDAGFLYTALKNLLPGGGIARFPVKFVLLAAFTVPMLAAFGVAWLMRPVGRDSVEPSIPPAVRAQRASPADADEDETRSARLAPLEMGLDGVSPYRLLLAVGLAIVAGVALIIWLGQQHTLQYDRWPETRANALVRLAWLAAALGAIAVVAGFGARAARERLLAAAALLVLLAADSLTHQPNQMPRVNADLLADKWDSQLFEDKAYEHTTSARYFITPEREELLLFGRHVSAADLPPAGLEGSKLAAANRQLWSMDLHLKREEAWSHLNLANGLAKVNGSSNLRLREQDALQRRLYPVSSTNSPAAFGLLDFLGVGNNSRHRSGASSTIRTSALPLVTAKGQPIFASPTGSLDLLLAPDFDPRRVVFFPHEAQGSVPTNAADARITTRRFAAHEILAEVETDAPTLVTVAQSLYHPWRAFVDGQPVKLWRANYAFQALAVPAGKHTVRLVYVDEKFRLGVGISLAGLAVCGFLWWRGRKPTEAVVT
ncbi:MAG: YfhO family protein [Verrucomicrobia bacterium]|nr:YfhO family protein [Verrucomicrobiota bacterium]